MIPSKKLQAIKCTDTAADIYMLLCNKGLNYYEGMGILESVKELLNDHLAQKRKAAQKCKERNP